MLLALVNCEAHTGATHGALYDMKHAGGGGRLDDRVRMTDAPWMLAVEHDAFSRVNVRFDCVIEQRRQARCR